MTRKEKEIFCRFNLKKLKAKLGLFRRG